MYCKLDVFLSLKFGKINFVLKKFQEGGRLAVFHKLKASENKAQVPNYLVFAHYILLLS